MPRRPAASSCGGAHDDDGGEGKRARSDHLLLLEPVREALILGQESPELKPSLSVGQVLLLAVAVPCYGRLAARLSRRALLNTVEATS